MTQIKIDKHFQTASEQASGLAWLVGYEQLLGEAESDACHFVIVESIQCLLSKTNGDSVYPDFENEKPIIDVLLPGGLNVIGIASIETEADRTANINFGNIAAKYGKWWSNIGVWNRNNECIVALYRKSDGISFTHVRADSVQPLIPEYVDVPELLFSSHNLFHTTCLLPLECRTEEERDTSCNAVQSKDTILICHPPETLLIQGNEGLRLYQADDNIQAIPLPCDSSSSNASDLLAMCVDTSSSKASSSKRTHKHSKKEKHETNMLNSASDGKNVYGVEVWHRAGSKVNATELAQAPSIVNGVSNNSNANMLKCSTLCFIPISATLLDVNIQIKASICTQINAAPKFLTSFGPIGGDAVAMHFTPSGIPFPVTVLYPIENDSKMVNDDALEICRQSLHQRLRLSQTPQLRSTCSKLFSAAKSDIRKRLKNVHHGLPSSGVTGGSLYLTDGIYEYHHYMQDGMDDKGWGCAYRSLQTLCSWLYHQSYTTKTAPSIIEIQKTLVTLGDKEENFVNSCQWIGAIECSLVLDSFCDISCRILNVNSGMELAEKGRELARHFSTNGTPVMVGGGVLAYTLLGIDFNEQTGDIRFLILDPHYVGPEDLSVIQSKGWCGWKGVDLFNKTAFYNLCMPIRPKKV